MLDNPANGPMATLSLQHLQALQSVPLLQTLAIKTLLVNILFLQSGTDNQNMDPVDTPVTV